MAKKKTSVFVIVGIIAVVLFLISLLVLVYNPFERCPANMVCLQPSIVKSMFQKQDAPITDPVSERDYRVLKDPLYPPLNRSDYNTTQTVLSNPQFNMATTSTNDKYRLVGYLTSQEERRDAGGNNWQLYARQKDRHTSDFYMIPANNSYDIKIAVNDGMVVGSRVRDIYDIPSEIQFNSPMLNKGTYQFTENPKTDFTNPIYV